LGQYYNSMPLNNSILVEELRKFTDPTLGDNFLNFPVDEADAIDKLVNAIDLYVNDAASGVQFVLLPDPVSTTQGDAITAFKTALSGMSVPLAGIVAVQAGILAYVTILGTGFTTYQPPVLPESGPDLSPTTEEPTAKEAAEEIADIVAQWFTEVSSVPIAGGTAIPWNVVPPPV